MNIVTPPRSFKKNNELNRHETVVRDLQSLRYQLKILKLHLKYYRWVSLVSAVFCFFILLRVFFNG